MKFKKFSLVSKGIKCKLRVSFCLMAVIPILVGVYLISTYILPIMGLELNIGITIVISIFIAVIGFFVIKEIADSVGKLSIEAQKIVEGDLERIIEVRTEDEIGRLGESLNFLTQKIKSNMQELKAYGEQTQKINLEVQKRILVLSSLLQISSLISSGGDLGEILNLVVDQIRQLGDSSLSFLILLKDGDLILRYTSGKDSEKLLEKKIDKERGFLGRVFQEGASFVLDKRKKVFTEHIEFQEDFGIKNSILLPIFLKGEIIGILGIGNSEVDFEYSADNLELLEVFSKQVAIAVESDLLIHRIKGLETSDALTGLYNDRFIRRRLQEEIKRAILFRRSCGFVILEVDGFRQFHDSFGELASEAVLKKISSILTNSVSEIDYVGRTSDYEFSIILPEKNKKRTQETAEEIRKKIESIFSEEDHPLKRLTVSGAVTENPLDGVTSEELIGKAKTLLSMAKKEKNRIFI